MLARPSRVILVAVSICALIIFITLQAGTTRLLTLPRVSLESLCGPRRSSISNMRWGNDFRASGPRANDMTRHWTKHETRAVRGTPGFMMFENLFLYKGVLFAITSSPETIPEATEILSDPPIFESDGTRTQPPATSQRWEVLTPSEADQKFGKQGAGVLHGVTFLFNDGPGTAGFLGHYFHFVAEVFSGAWRVLASSPSNLVRNTAMDTVFPARIMLPRGDDWRDPAGVNTWFLNTVLPNTAIEDIYQWEDRAKSDTIHMFPEIIIVDRRAVHRVQGSEAQVWGKMAADVFATPAPKDWYGPLRQSLMQRLGIKERKSNRPVITYISRQATKTRRLTNSSHDSLVAALHSFGEERDVEINAVEMEFLNKTEQFDIVTRTDILIGLHGNGLTHQIWMKPGGQILEFFDTGAFLRDYQLLAEAMYHTHYVIWNDTTHSTWRKDRKVTKQTPNFANVTVHAPFVIKLLGKLVSELKYQRPEV